MADFLLTRPFIRYVRERLDAIADQVLSIREDARRIRDEARQHYERPGPPVFVCVLVEGETPNGRGTCGGVGKLTLKGDYIQVELTTQWPMKDCRVTVFADLSRVSIHGIFNGVDLVTIALGSCPIAYFKEWHVGVKVMVQAELR